MKLTIVGGGITGVVTAILAKQKGFDVSLYEASNALGGILKDINYDNDWFFNNTQYLNMSGICYKAISKCLNTNLEVFTHEYCSITEVDGSSCFFKDFAQPVFTSEPPLIEVEELPDTIDKRLSLYGDESYFLKAFADRFGDLSNLCSSNLSIMQLSRVLYSNSFEEVQATKKSNKVANELFGLPRGFISPLRPKEKAILPKNGYDKLFHNLSEFLRTNHVDIHLNSPVSRTKFTNSNELEVYSRKSKIASDYIVWCANPISLLNETMSYKLSSPVTKAYCAVGICHYVEGLKPIYVQVFSLETSVLRIFLYNDGLSTKITIEGLEEYREDLEIASRVNCYLSKNFNTCIKSELHFEKQKRYVLLNQEDKAFMSKFREKFSRSNVISGSWEIYGRDQKVTAILDQLDDIS